MNQSRSLSGCGGSGARTLRICGVTPGVASSVAKRVRNGSSFGFAGVGHLLDRIEAVGLDMPLDLARVARRMLDDVRAALVLTAAEQHVVLREIGVTEHVRGDENVIREPIAGGEIRVAG